MRASRQPGLMCHPRNLPVPLRIAFDLDGVLADMESELVRQAEILFGDAMTHRLQAAPRTVRPLDGRRD